MLSAPLPGKRNGEYSKVRGGRKGFLKKNERAEGMKVLTAGLAVWLAELALEIQYSVFSFQNREMSLVWLPKAATIQAPSKRRSLREMWSQVRH